MPPENWRKSGGDAGIPYVRESKAPIGQPGAYQPPAPVPAPPAPAPAAPQATPPAPQYAPAPGYGAAPRRRSPVVPVLITLLVIGLMAGAGYGGYAFRAATVPARVAASPTPVPTPAVDAVSDAFKLSYTRPDGRSVEDPVTATFTAAQRFNTLIRPGGGCDASVSTTCESYSLANQLGDPTSLQDDNVITVYALQDWLNKNTTDPARAAAFAALTDPAKKKTAFDAVAALMKTSTITADRISSGELLNPFLSNGKFSGLSNIEFAQNGDGSLVGYSFIATFGQGPAYEPRSYTVLAGKVGDVPVLVAGSFQLNDEFKAGFGQKYPTVQQLSDFSTTYLSGYSYGKDTISQAGEATAIVKSFKLATK